MPSIQPLLCPPHANASRIQFTPLLAQESTSMNRPRHVSMTCCYLIDRLVPGKRVGKARIVIFHALSSVAAGLPRPRLSLKVLSLVAVTLCFLILVSLILPVQTKIWSWMRRVWSWTTSKVTAMGISRRSSSKTKKIPTMCHTLRQSTWERLPIRKI